MVFQFKTMTLVKFSIKWHEWQSNFENRTLQMILSAKCMMIDWRPPVVSVGEVVSNDGKLTTSATTYDGPPTWQKQHTFIQYIVLLWGYYKWRQIPSWKILWCILSYLEKIALNIVISTIMLSSLKNKRYTKLEQQT